MKKTQKQNKKTKNKKKTTNILPMFHIVLKLGRVPNLGDHNPTPISFSSSPR